MPYTHTTFLDLKTSLATRLGDSGNVYWLNGADSTITAELGLYIKESLRTWGLLTGYWTDSGQFTTTAGVGFYDISTLTNGLTTFLDYTVTDTDIISLIQYHLLEPATGNTWTGSEQFTLADITSALNKRRDAFLLETGVVLTSFTQILPAGSNTFSLPETTLRTQNMHWTGATSGIDWPILPDDIANQRNYSTSYLLTQGVPQTYSSISGQPFGFTIAPVTNEPGTLRVLVVKSGSLLGITGTPLGIPDDMSPAIKWGVLADMFGKEGPGQDLPRAYFCERRYKLFIELAKINGIVINAQINGVSLSMESIARLDSYNPNWYSSTSIPTFIASFRNYIALSPAPNGVFSIDLDVITKAIVPTVDSDFIQIGKEYLDIILDYAEHLAAFKCGGMEFRHTYRGAENFFNAAMSYNMMLAANNPTIVTLLEQSTMDDYTRPPKSEVNNPALQNLVQTSVQRNKIKDTYGQ